MYMYVPLPSQNTIYIPCITAHVRIISIAKLNDY